jgi:hypothetical protein
MKAKSFNDALIIVKQASNFKLVSVDYVCSSSYKIRPHLLDMARSMTS